MGDDLQLEFRRHRGGGSRSGISTGDRQELWTFKISSQIKHELTTLLTTAEAGYKTSIDQSDMCSCSFANENRQNVGCTSLAPEALTLMNFLSD